MGNVATFWRIILVLGLCLFVGEISTGQEIPEAVDAKFWEDVGLSRPAASAQLVLARDPFTIAAMRAKGLDNVTWGELGFGAEKAPSLDEQFLVNIRDGRAFPKVNGLLPKEVPVEDRAAYRAFNEALVNSREVPFDAFKKSGEENDWVTFSHLMSAPARYRGQVVKLQGLVAQN